jgi:hypothetical protein
MELSTNRAKEKYYILTRKEFDDFCKDLHKRKEFILSAGTALTCSAKKGGHHEKK